MKTTRQVLFAATLVLIFAGTSDGQGKKSLIPSHTQVTHKSNKPIEFVVASVRPLSSDLNFANWGVTYSPDGIRARSVSLLDLLQEAYGIFENTRLLGLPDWARVQRYDIDAKVDPAEEEEFRKLSVIGRQEVLQRLLGDRFRLVAHHEQRELPVYLIEVPGIASKLKPSPSSAKDEMECFHPASRVGYMEFEHCSMDDLAQALNRPTGRPVLNKTNLRGSYDFRLRWTPERVAPRLNSSSAPESADAPGIFTALTEQLGLKLRAAKAPIDCIVVDKVEKPAGN